MLPHIEGYEVLYLLDRGGATRVYLARRLDLGTLCTVELLEGMSPRVFARLLDVVKLQDRLRHGNVLCLADAVDLGGAIALVRPYIEGPTLAELLGSGVPLSVSEIDALARGILSGVAAAHEIWWVHRDIKPGNVLISVQSDALVPKVADFGLAKLRGEEHTAIAGGTSRSESAIKTYKTPESLPEHLSDPRRDVLALGALLYELIEGIPAFPTLSAWEDAIRGGRLPTLTREVPDRMRRAVLAALSERETRPSDAMVLLSLWEDGVPLVAPAFRADTLREAAKYRAHLP